MENQFYQMYLDELSEIPECTNEEMEALLNSLPNEEAVKRLTEGSLAYVVREAAKYAGNDVLNVVMTKLAEELGREPNLSEIAAKMQMSEDEVQAVMKEAINAVAVDRSEAAQKEDEALENQ